MCFKYKYKNERLLNIAKWRKHFLLRNCLKPNSENKNHKSNLHPQPPKGKHLKFLQLKKKEYKILPTEKEKTITDVGKIQREDVFNAHLRKSSEEHSRKQTDQN